MKYILIESAQITDLVKRVNEMIEQGYEPYGSLVFSECWETYIQPMMDKKSDGNQLD
jgi:hypothetical protein